jgi:1,4-alpha-glucan branching enzyme
VVTVAGDTAHFCFFRPAAEQVFLVGEFNHWQVGQLAMRRGEDGSWRASLRLRPGTYRFRYVADGTWYVDFAAFGLERGPHGHDSVLHIPPVAAAGASSRPALQPSAAARLAPGGESGLSRP